MAFSNTKSETLCKTVPQGPRLTVVRTEAIPGTLPVGMNSPARPAHGLYTEKISGSSFTAPRVDNQQSWLYRILPSASHEEFEDFVMETKNASPQSNGVALQGQPLRFKPHQLRFDPFDIEEGEDWVTGQRHLAGAGEVAMKTGFSISMFSAGKDMPPKQAYYSSDGDLLVVVQHGVLDVFTELGKLIVRPSEILIIPRGIRHRVTIPDGPVRGYILELHQGHFKLPELGFIGSNGLANARDFESPIAAYEKDINTDWTIISKFDQSYYRYHQDHSPFDVVGWHGLYYPYKYDLGRFNVLGSVSYDHPDPSIYTVLTAPSDTPGVAICDLAIFAPRWLVQEDTHRPAWYHRNTMAEFTSLIHGPYDAGKGGGLQPAGATLHNTMSAHGPDSESYDQAYNDEELKPVKVHANTVAFMFETNLILGVTDWAYKHSKKVQSNYQRNKWQPLRVRFEEPK